MSKASAQRLLRRFLWIAVLNTRSPERALVTFFTTNKGLEPMRYFLFVMFLAAFVNGSAFAACTSPAGQPSQTRYDFAGNKLYYCNNSVWVEMGAAGDKVSKSGDTMTGILTLSGAPTAASHAATKSYVDSVAAAAGGGGCYVVIPYCTNKCGQGEAHQYLVESCASGFTQAATYECAAGPAYSSSTPGTVGVQNGMCRVCCK